MTESTAVPTPLSRRRVIPGLGLSLGITFVWLGLIVLIPLVGVFVKASGLGWSGLWNVWMEPRVLSALSVSFGAALVAAAFNAVMGTWVAWVFGRYDFPGKRVFDAIIDLPFALPTAVAGIALAALYGPNGWIGCWLELAGFKIAYTPLGIVVALVFVGLPFVVRIVQPVLAEAEKELEEAAASLGANRWQTMFRVVLPTLWPAMLTGFALAFARGVGEYGSVIFIAGNLPNATEIAPLLITIRLEEFDYSGATAIAAVMLLLSFTVLLMVNAMQACLLRVKHRGEDEQGYDVWAFSLCSGAEGCTALASVVDRICDDRVVVGTVVAYSGCAWLFIGVFTAATDAGVFRSIAWWGAGFSTGGL